MLVEIKILRGLIKQMVIWNNPNILYITLHYWYTMWRTLSNLKSMMCEMNRTLQNCCLHSNWLYQEDCFAFKR